MERFNIILACKMSSIYIIKNKIEEAGIKPVPLRVKIVNK